MKDLNGTCRQPFRDGLVSEPCVELVRQMVESSVVMDNAYDIYKLLSNANREYNTHWAIQENKTFGAVPS